MKIDIFNHVMLPKYKEALYKYADRFPTEKAVQDKRPILTDFYGRIKKMEKYEGYKQVISTTMPPIEEVVSDPDEALRLARICNDEMAELVENYPDRFVGAIANIPLNNISIAIEETKRAIEKLKFKGIQIYTRVLGKPLSSEELFPLYKLMADYDLPIWIHPMRSSSEPDYAVEQFSYHQIFSIFGWPFETAKAMTRLVFSGIFERLPNIKFITHHAGGMIPYLSNRIVVHYDNGLERLGLKFFPGLKKHPIEYYRMFYADTALNGNPLALRCALEFFGEDHLLFGTDMPYDVENGDISIRSTIEALESMIDSHSVKEKVFYKNAQRILKLN
ncbi:MAG: amidohydrolase [Desulfobacterota bacterium]|nr:amidohydrolase [Thermodesulfobacteriota bacterium]MDW8001908.1 amidohydrolase family protein [Deltaproteobacteria bacterium]